jgi:dTDP-4-dehydrorhamnose 3,5-epimerase
MPFTATPTAIADVIILEPKVFGDVRGWFYESFNARDFENATGVKTQFVQDNHSLSKKGVLRGLHYQTEYVQGKLVRVTSGAVFDVAVDIRESSPTFGKWIGVELSAQNQKQLWIPPGLAHAFLVLSDEAQFLYKTTDYWHASSEKSIVWNDSNLAINWPQIGMEPLVNAKDQAGFTWEQAPKFA